MSDNDYYNTFIAVADDCPVDRAKAPKARAKPTIATLQFEMLHENPFVHRQSDVLFDVWLARQDLESPADDEVAALRQAFFDKPQACLRASPLPKTHGWGIAFDADGRAALVAVESADYAGYLDRPDLQILKAMRSSRA